MSALTLPASVPFPVKVTAVQSKIGSSVRKHDTLLKYSYWDYQDDPNSKDPNPPKIRVERIGTFESPVEGEVVAFNVHINDEITHADVEICQIQEACSHTVQYGGLCALCGKAVEDEKDYLGYNFEDRATIAMSHDNTGLKISLDEARKIEDSTNERLAASRKLILVVDLDQTVIHATVDPTVGEWQRDPSNPNYPYVKDVKYFSLVEEPVLPPTWLGAKPPATECWYYVQVRPGLEEFLAQVLELYELHIYTMATRNYALAIANIIDPTRKYFGDRILSRDESGSLTHKNLKRLFPVDQSMVAIIDDRGDVWQWESNLVKVVPYDFFVGIGDINSSFLPKKNGQLVGPTKRRKTIARLEAMEEVESLREGTPEASEENNAGKKGGLGEEDVEGQDDEAPNQSNLEEGNNSDDLEQRNDDSDGSDYESEGLSPVDRILRLGGGENNKDLLIEQLISRSQLVEQQQHDRPLAKLQHNLDKIIHDTPSPESSKKEEDEEHLLFDDDTELAKLQVALKKIHGSYYEEFEQFERGQSTLRPDLTAIIPRLKKECLSGIVILFSGIIPLGMNIDNADIVIWCRQFGVKVVNDVYPEVTHVVCRDPRSQITKAGLTLKVRMAKRKLPNVAIVDPDWLFACLSAWKKVDESNYLIDVPPQDWEVNEADAQKFEKALQIQESKRASKGLGNLPDSPIIEEYNFDEANAEIDDFLADVTDEEDDDIVDNQDDEDSATNEKVNPRGSSFLKGLYAESRNKRRANEEEDEEDDEHAIESKKPRVNGFDDMDELEQELMDEMGQLDED